MMSINNDRMGYGHGQNVHDYGIKMQDTNVMQNMTRQMNESLPKVIY